jgi:hypothetical protein
MGRYMEVYLKKKYINEATIQKINLSLKEKFGANSTDIFISEAYLKDEAEFFNSDPEGMKQLPDFKRPLTPQILSNYFIWYQAGFFQFKISGCVDPARAVNAVAVCHWIKKSQLRYIDTEKSSNFQPRILHQYLDHYFTEGGYDLQAIWKIPA